MNKKQKGLKVSEVLLITVVVLLGIAVLVAFLIYNGPTQAYLNLANNYFVGILTLGTTLPRQMEVGGKVVEMRNLMFVLVDLFVVVSLIMTFAVLVMAFAKKKWRSLSGVCGLGLSTLLIAYGSGFIVPVLSSGYTISRSRLCPIIGVGALVLVTYVASVIALLDEFKGDLVMAALPEEVKHPAPAKEEAAPAPAPAAQPVEVKVVVEHKDEPKPEPAPAPVVEAHVEEPVPEKRKIERVPFEYKILHADRDLKKKYAELKEYFESYGLKGRISVDGDSFRLHRVLYAQITVAGKKMKVYFKLRTMDFINTPMPVKDASHVKKYADIPCELDVKSDLSVKRAKELMDKVMAEAGFERKLEK